MFDLTEIFKLDYRKLQKHLRLALVYKITATVFAAYFIASLISSIAMSLLLDVTLAADQLTYKSTKVAAVNIKPEFQNIRTNILDRNLFNSSGEFPDESEDLGSSEPEVKTFDLDAPCNKTNLSIELIGTIYTGNPATSIATVREKGIEAADIYRMGDEIINGGGASVAMINRRTMILNNNGVKECLELKDPEKVNFGAYEAADNNFQENEVPVEPKEVPKETPKPAEDDGGVIKLQSGWVEEELGQGFSKVIQAARMVPNGLGADMNGFKIFGIKSGTLMGKLFREGDIVKQVNETSLSQPDQGFALYQAFQDDEEIRIHVLRGGQEQTIVVKIE